jgi:hypothetical protein
MCDHDKPIEKFGDLYEVAVTFPSLPEHELVRRLQASFSVRCESTRGAPWAGATEMAAIARWARNAFWQYMLVQGVLNGQFILDLEGAQPYGREPTEAEASRLRRLNLRRFSSCHAIPSRHERRTRIRRYEGPAALAIH